MYRGALLLLTAGLAACGAGATSPPSPASSCAALERHVRAQAVRGRAVAAATARLQGSTALAEAVAQGDAPAARAALRPLMRSQIKRIVIRGRDGHPLLTAGHARPLASVNGVLGRDGATVGTYSFSVATVGETVRLLRELTGGRVTFAGDTLSVSGRCDAASVAHGLYRAERHGRHARDVLRIVATDRGVLHAVATDDSAALRARIVHFFRDPRLHVVCIRATTSSGRVVNDVGGPYVLAPTSRRLTLHGRTIGRVTLSIQDDAGYLKLIQRFTGAKVRLESSLGPVPGSAPAGPPTARFTVKAFPSGPLRVTLLD